MIEELALQRDKYKHLSDAEWRWFLQQEEGRERTADKLPSFAATEGWWYPVRLSCEQCSSEATARYKSLLVNGKCPTGKCLDLTGGYGVDTFFLSGQFAHTCYVEQDAELCRIAAHNFSLADKNISVYNTSAEEFLSSPLHGGDEGGFEGCSLIFLDPARRDSHGGKVFRLADCTPDVVKLLPALLTHLAPDGLILLKLSPMIDLTQAIKELSAGNGQRPAVCRSVHIVAVKNEVKEVLLLMSRSTDISENRVPEPLITAIDLARPGQAFTFTKEEEQAAQAQMVNDTLSNGTYLYEPGAAILKAGAYKLAALRFGLQKLDVNTHLYASGTLNGDFPGRVWKASPLPSPKERVISQANVLVRNYPLTAEQLKKKLRVRDGGTDFIIGCRVAGKPTLFLAERIL